MSLTLDSFDEPFVLPPTPLIRARTLEDASEDELNSPYASPAYSQANWSPIACGASLTVPFNHATVSRDSLSNSSSAASTPRSLLLVFDESSELFPAITFAETNTLGGASYDNRLFF